MKEFPELKGLVEKVGEMILDKSGISRGAIPIVPRDHQYFLIAGFNIQLYDKTGTIISKDSLSKFTMIVCVYHKRRKVTQF